MPRTPKCSLVMRLFKVVCITSARYGMYPAHLMLLHVNTLINWCWVQIVKLLIMYFFFHHPMSSSLLGPDILQHFVLNTVLGERDEVLHTQNKTFYVF